MNSGSTIAAELIALLEGCATTTPFPRVRALHLPRPETLDTRRGEFCALELEDGTLGLAFVLLGDTWAQLASTRCSSRKATRARTRSGARSAWRRSTR